MSGIGGQNEVQAHLGKPRLLMVSFTTDSTGAATLDDDYNGTVSIADTTDSLGPTGVHTITFADVWAVSPSKPHVTHGKMSTVTVTATSSASAGTITVTFGAALTSSEAVVSLMVSDTHAN